MRAPLHKILLILHDVIIIGVAILLSNIFYSNYSAYFELGQLSSDLRWGFALIFITVLVAFNEYDLYKYQVILSRLRHFTNLQKALFMSFVGLVFFSFVFKTVEVSSSRVLLGLIYLNTAILFIITRMIIIPNIFYALVRKKMIKRNLLIVGAGKLSTEHAEELIDKNNNSYFNIIGLVDDETCTLGDSVEGVPVLGNISDLEFLVNNFNIHDILVASDCKSDDVLHDIIENCKASHRTVHIVSELYNVATEKIQIEEIGKVSAFRYVPPQPGKRLIYPYAKRLFDITLASAIVLLLLPLWLLIAILIKMASQGPIFYKALAVGKNGKLFLMYKFRSMRMNASTKLHEDMVKKMIVENGATTKLVNDPRVTRIGRFLRKLSLDEFPQLINVLKGEMSLVGPRPCLPYEYEVMKEWQKQRCQIEPGMTGIWQIKGRDEVLFSEQVVLDLYYKEHRTLWMDLEIMLGTIPVVLFGRGGA